MKGVIKLFENCFISIGAERSLLVDMQRDHLYFIPNSLACLFNEKNILDFSSVEEGHDNLAILNEYSHFIIENELGFHCDIEMIDNFPTIDFHNWDTPAVITNAIIEVNLSNFENHYKLIKELADKYLTRHIEVSFSGPYTTANLAEVLDKLDALDLYSYNFIVGLALVTEKENVVRMLQNRHKIFRSIIHTAGENEILESGKDGWGNIFVLKDKFTYKACGIIDKYQFCTSIEHISESQDNNSCLNRKIMIDIDGNIKNCPGFEHHHGNIKEVSLQAVLSNQEFTKYWKITKEQIATCKDCEFRHICTDCRAFLEDPQDIYSKPLKCGYDPYTNKWEDWSQNPLKQSIITHYKIEC